MLEAKGLTKRYGTRTVLSPISLQLEPGQCLGLAGANGSGKSTLISILAQTLRPDGGKLLYQGRSVLGDRAFLRQKLGYVPQQSALLGDLTVSQQLKLWQHSRGLAEGLSPTLMDLLGLDELSRQRIEHLSGGQKRRVSIALGCMGSPELLLMDEAFAALDSGYRTQMTQWLIDHLSHGGSILWCSHEDQELTQLCHSLLLLEQGKLVFSGSCSEGLPQLHLLQNGRGAVR